MVKGQFLANVPELLLYTLHSSLLIFNDIWGFHGG
jgi:hypothetical protein